MKSIFLSISSGTGLEECARAAALTLEMIIQDIHSRDKKGEPLRAVVIETEASRVRGNIRSALLLVEGPRALSFAREWTGSIQWIWKSDYRPHHKRKNWFVSVKSWQPPENGKLFSPCDVRFETARSTGPGGQNVNKTETAVRAVHIPSGKSVVCREQRSQVLNRKTALLRLEALFRMEEERRQDEARSGLRHSHYELERGNPIKIYDGKTLCLLADYSSHKIIPAKRTRYD
ncbi:MAG: peptide chain release factor H [Spirochaetales bacterium]|nr:peptide chain release factor H [Spirochaetales bacterium]